MVTAFQPIAVNMTKIFVHFHLILGQNPPKKKRKLVLRAPLIQMPGYKLVKCQDYTKWIEYEANIYLQRSKDMQKNTDVAIFVYVYWP